VKLVVDKKEMAELFFDVRRWQMMPPVFIERRDAAALDRAAAASSSVVGSRVKPVEQNQSEILAIPSEKTYGNGDNRTRWNAQFDDPVVNQEFERFRQSQVDKFLVEYQKGKQDFLLMHGERTSRAFIETLDDYLFPEPYPHEKNIKE
jgi:hypothetical protein